MWCYCVSSGRAVWAALSLNEVQKVYVSVVSVSIALAFGRASPGAVEAGIVSQDVLDYGRLVAQAALVANLLSVPAVGFAVRSSGRVVAEEGGLAWGQYAAWLVKTALCGPMALLQARTALSPTTPPTSDE